MKKALALTGIILCLCSMTALPGREKPEFSTYKEMREHLGGLFKAKKYEEAAALLESVLDRFPDHIVANTYNLALARLYQGDPEKSGLAVRMHMTPAIGYWYPKDFESLLDEALEFVLEPEEAAVRKRTKVFANGRLQAIRPGVPTSRVLAWFMQLEWILSTLRPVRTSPNGFAFLDIAAREPHGNR